MELGKNRIRKEFLEETGKEFMEKTRNGIRRNYEATTKKQRTNMGRILWKKLVMELLCLDF